MNLRNALQTYLQDWKSDLSAPWRKVFDGVDLDFDNVRADLELHEGEFIFPARKKNPIAEAPPRAHVFRAFDGIHPQDVRAVVIGQDPYPNVTWATGRAFEQGNLREWTSNARLVADSLARIVQVLVAARTNNPAYAAGDSAWKQLISDNETGVISLEPPPELFNNLQKKGVLFLNAGLTISRFVRGGAPEQIAGHIPLWKPIIAHVLRWLARRPGKPVVFLLWGNQAKGMFEESGVEEAAREAGTWETGVVVVSHSHPAAGGAPPLFFRSPNSFLRANEVLTEMGASQIQW
ncbi:MAG TPA: hypothetical protein VF599_14675 [Pyrinomonadaceae bacterium]|jgi:uracil-DNA glycosylase